MAHHGRGNHGARHSERVLSTVESAQAAALSAVAASWCRSALHHKLDPEAQRRGERLAAGAISSLRQANGELLAAAEPTLDRLYRTVGVAGACVIITDLDGVVLESRSADADADFFDAVGLAPGAAWSEQAEGTNGIGTCLVEARPVTILRDEHFASRNVGVSCMDAPIFDPQGRLVAALDVSTARADHAEAMAGMIAALVQDAARSIERDFFCRHYGQARIVYAGGEQPGRGSALLAVDRDDLVIGATRAARRALGLAADAKLAPRPLSEVMGQGPVTGFEDGERAVLRQALARCNGNVAAAARLLGIGRATMYRRMERAGMSGLN